MLNASGLEKMKKKKTATLASIVFDGAFKIGQDEEKVIDFKMSLAFNQKGSSVNIKGWNITIVSSSPLDSTDGFFSPTTRFEVVATVDLEGVAPDPMAKNQITIMR